MSPNTRRSCVRAEHLTRQSIFFAGSISLAVTLRCERSEPRRATARIDPSAHRGRSSFEARPLAGHLRMTDSDRCIGCCDGYPPREEEDPDRSPSPSPRVGEPGSVSLTVTLRCEHRRQVYAACASLAACEPRRATARIVLRIGGRASFEARPLAGHLRMTDND